MPSRSALANAETTIRSGTASPAALVDLGRSQDASYQQLVEQPEWQATVLAQLPEALRPIARANIAAGQELKALDHPRDTLPAWRILAPLPEAELRADYLEAPDLAPQPGVGQIPALIERTRDAGQRLTLQVQGEPGPLPASIDLGVYRLLEDTLHDLADLTIPIAVALRFGPEDIELDVTFGAAARLGGRCFSR